MSFLVLNEEGKKRQEIKERKSIKQNHYVQLTVEMTGSSNDFYYKSLQNQSLMPCMIKITASLKPQSRSK